MTQAVVFVLSKHLLPNASICYQYCLMLGYNTMGLVLDDWAKAWSYVTSGEADLIVVADPQDMEPDRAPRVEVVSHSMQQGAGPAGARPGTSERTHIVRRRSAEA